MGEINFVIEYILKAFDLFLCLFYCYCLYSLWAGAYGNRIDKLGKMIRSQLTTKVLQTTFLGIND